VPVGGAPGTEGLAGLGWLGAGGLGTVGLGAAGLGTEGLLGPPGCMLDPGTWAAAVPAKQRPASARVIPIFHVVMGAPLLSRPGNGPNE
jgi:hypothetical protein